MIEFNSVFIDTAPYIYMLEHNDNYVDSMKVFFEHCINNNKVIVTSTVTIEEFLVFPYKNDDRKLIEDFQSFLKDTYTIISNIDENIAMEAARIRANYNGFKGMDALQLATAKRTRCDLFLTNDKQLKQFIDLKVLTVEEIVI